MNAGTLKDVANRLHLSVSTVSRVVNGKGYLVALEGVGGNAESVLVGALSNLLAAGCKAEHATNEKHANENSGNNLLHSVSPE